MDKEDAITYLQEKEEIKGDIFKHPKFNKQEEAKIKEVMKKGKIYSDPVVILD